MSFSVPAGGVSHGSYPVALGAPGYRVVDGTPVTLTNTTETTIAPGIAGIFLDMTAILIANSSGTNVRCDIRDSTGGAVRLRFAVPAGATQGISLTRPKWQNTAGSNWTAQLSAGVTQVDVWIQTEQRQ